ncbi:MAG TPA: gliding motility-associated C-terminal domain-containing protein [Edaphocola sp.]|nr:gliding motility-associated C-terminal domain-containing protein [Edaphocola sp.]
MNFNKIYKKSKLSFLGLGMVLALWISGFTSYAQGPGVIPDGTSCITALPFCTDTVYNFPNSTNAPTAPAGYSYACLASRPNPVWYYMKIGNPGTLQITVNQLSLGGTGLDVDFAMWGPFASLNDGCAAITGLAAPIQSSYSNSTQEIVGIGLPGGVGGGAGCMTTPPAALTGQYYILLLTNYSNQPGSIQFSKTAGTATTDCSILTCGITLDSNAPICQGDSLRLFLDNSNDSQYVYNYYWEGTGGLTSTDKNPVFGGLNFGTYNFTVNAVTQLQNGNYDTCTEQIQIEINPSYNKTIVEYICEGDSLLWYDKHIKVSGDYDSLFHTAEGCDSLVTTVLNVMPRPTSIQMLDSIIACQYDSVAIETNALPPNSSYTYSWTPDINLNRTDNPNVWFYADESRDYQLTVTNTVDGIPCSISKRISIIVNPGDFLIAPLTDTGICPGEKAQFVTSGASKYQWTPAIYLDNPNVANPIITAETSTKYRLIGTSDKGCTDTIFFNVEVYPAPVLGLPDFVNIYPGERYQITPNTNALFFKWYPNSGLSNENASNPVASPIKDTRYFVTAKTEEGCSIYDSVDFFVKETVLDMPNAFNPNTGSFKVSIRGIANIQSFEIYNRWGTKIFETTDINEGWDGSYLGAAQPMGVYIYQIKAKTIEGRPFKKTGNVTLIR